MYRYIVEVTDSGQRMKAHVFDSGGQLKGQPGGECRLIEVAEKLSGLTAKVRRGTARVVEMQELGELLFAALFPADVASHFRDLMAQAGREKGGVRLELDLDEAALPSVAALPWELLRAPQTEGRPGDFLATHSLVTLTRRRRLWQVVEPVVLREPLKIQLIVSAPKDDDLGEVVYMEVEEALRSLANKHQEIAPPLQTVHQPNLIKLEEILEERRPHILHFIGHGRLSKSRGVETAELGLVEPSGYVDWHSDTEFAELFQAYPPDIVILQACESGAESSRSPFVGIASQLVQRNIPIVVGMQFPISNLAAVNFAETFYERLGRLEPVDVAVQRARKALKQRYRQTRDFAAPVLFMRVADGQIFKTAHIGQPDEEERTQSADPAGPHSPSALSVFKAQRCRDLAGHMEEILDLIRQYEEINHLSDNPLERRRAEKQINELRQQLQGYQQEFDELGCGLEGKYGNG